MSDPGTIIGAGTEMVGTLEIDHAIRVEGTFRGRVTTATMLHVSEGGRVESEDILDVGSAEIHGAVSGTIRAREFVHFGPTARVRGLVETPRLIVEEGAMIDIVPADRAEDSVASSA